MDLTITATYCLCEEFSKAMGLCDDSQAQMTTAEVMCVALVAAAFFSAATSRKLACYSTNMAT